ncbi:MAG: hypothetical protein CMH13_18725 [Martelella sp.]|uniref:phage head spike fiber domain-containing protein n=1 Tax=unclassified Martelella TaxID=2629616 RepID=UPI000C425978|nr:hypothetical protein [Martelella sp.]MAU22534.1 hypothetical protein [Martelella sp.]
MAEVLEITSDPNGIFSASGLSLLADPDATAGSYPVSYRVLRNGRVLLERSDTITVSASPYKAANAAGGAGWPGALLDFSGDHYRLTANADIENASAEAIWYPAPSVGFSDVVTFTRAGAATYIDANGFLQVAASGAPRFDNSTGRRGLLLEPSATNLCVNKNVSLLEAGANTIVTPMPGEIGPDGVTGNVYRVQLPAEGNTFVRLANVVGGSQTAVSAYVKQYDPGSRQFAFGFDGSVNNLFEATTDWARYESTGTAGVGSIALVNNISFAVSDTYASDILVAFPQVEAGSRATSYIPTSGSAVTRPADRAQLSEPVAALLRRSEASIVIQGEGVLGASGRLIGGAAGTRLLGFDAGQTAIVAGNAATLSLGAVSTPLPSFGVAVGYHGAGKRGSYNGDSVLADTVAIDADLTAALIGRDSAGNFARGWYYQLVIWPFRMTDADLQTRALPYA